MADPVWPAGVPSKLLRDDMSGAEPHLPPRATEMEGGVIRMRPSSTVPITTLQGSIFMTEAQFETFRQWVKTTINQGTAEFMMPVFQSAAYVTKRVQLVGGTYKWARYGLGWRVTLGLRIWDW